MHISTKNESSIKTLPVSYALHVELDVFNLLEKSLNDSLKSYLISRTRIATISGFISSSDLIDILISVNPNK